MSNYIEYNDKIAFKNSRRHLICSFVFLRKILQND